MVKGDTRDRYLLDDGVTQAAVGATTLSLGAEAFPGLVALQGSTEDLRAGC